MRQYGGSDIVLWDMTYIIQQTDQLETNATPKWYLHNTTDRPAGDQCWPKNTYIIQQIDLRQWDQCWPQKTYVIQQTDLLETNTDPKYSPNTTDRPASMRPMLTPKDLRNIRKRSTWDQYWFKIHNTTDKPAWDQCWPQKTNTAWCKETTADRRQEHCTGITTMDHS